MFRSIIYLFLLLPLFTTPLIAQVEDLSQQAKEKDLGKRTMLNNGGANQALIKGGAFFVSNPPPALELDPHKAYFRTEWDSLVVRLMDGRTAKLMGRYRVIDQKFEINEDGEIYEIFSSLISKAKLGDDNFVLLPDGAGTKIYQLHFKGGDYRLWSHHRTEWNEPEKQTMFDTREVKKTMRREEDIYLLYPGGQDLIKNRKELIKALGIAKGGPELKYAKKAGLDLRKVAGIKDLLVFMTEEK